MFKVASSVGLDVDRLKHDMAAPDIDRMLKANLNLAEALDIRGTPGFVIGNEIVPGAVSLDDAETADRRGAQQIAPAGAGSPRERGASYAFGSAPSISAVIAASPGRTCAGQAPASWPSGPIRYLWKFQRGVPASPRVAATQR